VRSEKNENKLPSAQNNFPVSSKSTSTVNVAKMKISHNLMMHPHTAACFLFSKKIFFSKQIFHRVGKTREKLIFSFSSRWMSFASSYFCHLNTFHFDFINSRSLHKTDKFYSNRWLNEHFSWKFSLCSNRQHELINFLF
jgi:hypothetical protein